MAKVTLFELHLDGAEFTANAPAFGSAEEEAETESAESGGRLGSVLLAVGVLAVLAVVAVALKKRLGGSEDAPSLDLDEE